MLDNFLIVLKGGPPSDKGPGSGNYPRNAQGHIDFFDKDPDTYYNGQRDAWLKTLSPAQRDTINHYSVAGYGEMNRKLRRREAAPINGSNSTQEQVRQHIKNLYESMHPLKEDTVVYRGTGFDGSKLPVGQPFRDQGFVSTSLSAKVAQDDGAFISSILLPKGTKVAYGVYDIMSTTAQYKGRKEYEIILPPNTAFKITGHKDMPIAFPIGTFSKGGPRPEMELVKTKKEYPTTSKHVSF